ncbi:MAG: sigma-70 family RNA polymerase sigma factor [Opitutaceae bacterium]|nr:sigma-70 family RNA polymerase sigma factor [Opitutaceae bacterium]
MDPDLPLIEALQAGEDLALNELIQRHREPLFHFAFRYLRNEAAARDVVQETFVRVYFKAGSFKPHSAVKTWLYTITANLCRDRLRRLAKHRQDISIDAPAAEHAAVTEQADARPNPAEQSAQADQFKVLQRAIDQLPHTLKLPLILSALEGKTHKETAEILDTTPKTVELRIYHAKAKLRELLSGSARE